MTDYLSIPAAPASLPPANQSAHLTKLYDRQPYTAFSEDLDFMWRWTIYCDQKLMQEGCSLTLDASRHAVNHVLAFFNVAVNPTTATREH